MALSGSCVVKATSHNNLIFSWAAAQDIAGNRSKVTWQMQLTAGQYGRIVATPGSAWEVTVAGQVFSGTTSLAIENHETKVLASGEIWLDHDSLGKRSFDFAFRQEFWIHFDGQSIRIVSGQGSAVLDDIPRASQPTMPASADMGQAVTIATNRVSSFTHTLEYSFGNTSGVIAQGVADAVRWTPSLELARQIPNDTGAVATITCTTFAGGKAIGSKQTTILLHVPDSVRPTAQADWEDLSGAYHTLGTLVQNISRLSVSVQGTGAYGSTITGAAVTLSGKAYGGGCLTDSGELSLEVSVTDSRGRVGSMAYPITVAAYAIPTVMLSASRCDASGNADDNGDHAKITVTGFLTQVEGKNQGHLTVQWGSGSETAELPMGSYRYEKIVYADPNDTMAISAEVADRLVSAERAMTLSTGYATLDLLAGGKGIAFGKAATREGFECAMPAYFTGQLYADSGGNPVPMFPAMGTGTEYQTPEWFRGYPVFRKIVNFGELASNTYKAVQVSSEDITVIEANVVIRGQSSATTIMLPYESGSKKYWHYATNKSLVIYTNSDAAGYTAFAEVRYIKGYKG